MVRITMEDGGIIDIELNEEVGYYKKDSLTNIKRKGFREEALRCFYTMDI